MNEHINEQNIEIIDGVPINWSKFKSDSKDIFIERSKRSYIGLCELLHKNENTLLSEYVSNSEKVLIDFNCGHQPHWIKPNSYKSGGGCPECFGIKKKRVAFGNIVNNNGHKLLSEYNHSLEKVLIDFKCNHEPHWITPNSYKSGTGCPKCSKDKTVDKVKEQTKEEFVNLLNNNGHKLLSEYVNSATKVKIDFNCGHQPHWLTPNSYKSGRGCPKCKFKNRSTKAKEDFLKMIEDNGHKLLSEYIDSVTKVEIDFNCGHKPHWIRPNSYKSGTGCPKCVIEQYTKAKEDFLKMIEDNGHKLLSEYIDSVTKVKIDFNCGHKPHWLRPSDYKYRGGKGGCPLCKHKGESALYELLINMGYKAEKQKKYEDLRDKRLLSYDFYLPQYNLLIELDGEHHRDKVVYCTKDMIDAEKDLAKLEAKIRLKDRKHKDKLKDDYAKNNNIPLLRIEYNNGKIELDKWRELIQSKIRCIENSKAA